MDQASSLRKIVGKRVLRQPTSVSGVKADSGAPPRVVAVTSGKGGVGKTNIVGNLAVALAGLGKHVLILDADLGLANIDIIFGIHPEYTIGHVIRGEKTLAEIIVDGPNGVRLIPAGSGFVNLTHLTEGQKLSLLTEFEALEARIDVLLIDTCAGISENVVYFNLAADDCVIVATPEPTSITDAYAMMKVMATQHGTKHLKLLVNMVKDLEEAKSVYMNLTQAADRFLKGVSLEYVGFLPMDDMVKKAVRQRKTVLEAYPETAFSRNIRQIAQRLLAWPWRTDTDGNIKFFLRQYIEYRTPKPSADGSEAPATAYRKLPAE